MRNRQDKFTRDPRDYIEAWYKEQCLKGTTKLTVDAYLVRVKALLDVHHQPNAFDITDYLSTKQQAGSMSGTIANYIKAFRSFFGYLFANSLYDLDYRCLRLPKIKHRERRVPTDEEIGKLVNTLDRAEDTIALLLLVDCGIRIHELVTIKIQNINLDDASILIHGKGGKTRIVYLSQITLTYLGEYIKTRHSDYLFSSTRADAVITHRCTRYFQKRLAKLCEKAGIEQITPHQLRHYFATRALSNGADVKAVSEMLGHADVGITLKIYHHVNARAIREMHNKYSPASDFIVANSPV